MKPKDIMVREKVAEQETAGHKPLTHVTNKYLVSEEYGMKDKSTKKSPKIDEKKIQLRVRQIIYTSRSIENLFDKIVEYIKELIEVDK